jgi:hypothetical protein
MAYTLELKKEHGYVRLTFLGTITRKELELVLLELYFELSDNILYKIFIDIIQSEISIGDFELYSLITEFISKYHLDVTISILARSDQMRTMHFIEAAANIKHIKLRVHQDQQFALDWLLNSQSIA